MREKLAKKILIGFFVIFVVSSMVGTLAMFFPRFQAPKTSQSKITNEAIQKAMDYINNILASQGQKAELLSFSEESGLYKIKIKVGDREFESFVSKDGKFLFPQAIDLTTPPQTPKEAIQPKSSAIGDFLVANEKICKENGKPVIYFFGSTRCPHCRWEHPIVEKVASKFKENIVFHNNMDSDKDMDIFSKYSSGGIPTLVLGCKYYRVGSGERMGEEEESKVLTALICKLTENQPADICNSVQDLINQINE